MTYQPVGGRNPALRFSGAAARLLDFTTTTLWTALCRVMKQALAAVIPVPENTPGMGQRQATTMKNGINEGTRLEAVRPGDILTLQHSSFRVLSSQRDEDLVTLILDDAPQQPLTFIGLRGTAVCINSGLVTDGGTPMNPTSREAPADGQHAL